jgi:flagellar operon protein
MVEQIQDWGLPIRPAPGTGQTPGSVGQTGRNQGSTFQKVLDTQIAQEDRLKFSAHAQERIRLRNISLDSQGIERLESAVEQIAEKGGRESLVFLDNAAFLVSVRNKTVITAINGESLKNNIFTNIDSAVVV